MHRQHSAKPERALRIIHSFVHLYFAQKFQYNTTKGKRKGR